MKDRPLGKDIFLVNHIICIVGVVVILGVFSNLFFPKHNEFYFDLVKFTDILVLIAFLYWLVSPLLLALFSSFVISRFFYSIPSAIAVTTSSILFVGFVLFSYYYTWFIDSSESGWMLLLIWPVAQFIVYGIVLAITWFLTKLLTLRLEYYFK